MHAEDTERIIKQPWFYNIANIINISIKTKLPLKFFELCLFLILKKLFDCSSNNYHKMPVNPF